MENLTVNEVQDTALRKALSVIERYIINCNCEECELRAVCDQTEDSLCEIICR